MVWSIPCDGHEALCWQWKTPIFTSFKQTPSSVNWQLGMFYCVGWCWIDIIYIIDISSFQFAWLLWTCQIPMGPMIGWAQEQAASLVRDPSARRTQPMSLWDWWDLSWGILELEWWWFFRDNYISSNSRTFQVIELYWNTIYPHINE